MGVGYPPDALPDAPLGVRARISRARALWVLGGEALSVRATSWGAHSGVQTLRSVARSSLSLALLSALRDELALLMHPPAPARRLRGVRSTYQQMVGEVRARGRVRLAGGGRSVQQQMPAAAAHRSNNVQQPGKTCWAGRCSQCCARCGRASSARESGNAVESNRRQGARRLV